MNFSMLKVGLVLWLLHAISLLAILLAAPAPLPKKELPPKHINPPSLCTMTWAGGKWRTEFSKNGTYVATPEHTTAWRGFWRVSTNKDGHWILHVKERANEDSGWMEWEVRLLDALSPLGGKILGGVTEVRLEYFVGKPDT